jgi:hypothetical protein
MKYGTCLSGANAGFSIMSPQFAAMHKRRVGTRRIARGRNSATRAKTNHRQREELIKSLGTRRGDHGEARVPVQDISSECPFHRQRQPVVLPSFAGRNIRRRRWLGIGASCLFMTLFWGCTARPIAADPPAASAPPARLEPVDSVAPATPAVPHGKTADKRTPHKAHKTRPAETRQAEIIAAIEPRALIGKEPSAVEKLLGSPSDISQKDVSLIWTYGSPDCAFQVYFYPDIKTSMFHALQYAATRHDGGKIDLAQGCIQRLLIVRK